MPWIQMKLQAPGKVAGAVEETLLARGAVAVTLQDSGDQPLFEPPPGATPLWVPALEVVALTSFVQLWMSF